MSCFCFSARVELYCSASAKSVAYNYISYFIRKIAMSSVGDLSEVLKFAASQNDPAQLKAAEERLRTWEAEPGFYSALMV